MSRWTETHVWLVEGFTTQDIWTRGGAAPGRWMRVRFSYGNLEYVRGKLTPKMTLSAAMGCAKQWARTNPRHVLRIRRDGTQDAVLADVL